MGDRAFCSFCHLALLQARGVFACVRLHQRRKEKSSGVYALEAADQAAGLDGPSGPGPAAQEPGRAHRLLHDRSQGLPYPPRSFALDPSVNWLLAGNQDSGNVAVFKVDVKTGDLKPSGQTIAVADPVCVMFAPK
jgi:hypothetical protein